MHRTFQKQFSYLLSKVKVLVIKLVLLMIVTTVVDILAAIPSLAESGSNGSKDAYDPFAGLDTQYKSAVATKTQATSSNSYQRFFADNFTFKKELYSQLAYGSNVEQENSGDRWYSRQSLGFEALKKFSTQTSTIASFDFQGRLVRRDNFIPVIDDEEGANREGWYAEYHNVYLDLYNFLNPVLSDADRGAVAGNFNFRLGRFYLPFGINQQTDTHGTILQLSNERNFGFERDWYAGLWGSINRDLNYDLYYLLGSGYDPSFKGQDGLLGSRVSLSNTYLNECGIEGGLSIMAGQRRSGHALERSSSVADRATNGEFIQTQRFGVDTRYTHIFAKGSLSGTTELSAGKDESDNVFTQLYQLEYLHHSRKWGIGSQYRRFYQDFGTEGELGSDDADTSIIGELTWFFRNDIGNTNLHWIKLNVERQLESMEGGLATIVTIQYYRYW